MVSLHAATASTVYAPSVAMEGSVISCVDESGSGGSRCRGGDSGGGGSGGDSFCLSGFESFDCVLALVWSGLVTFALL